MRAREPAHVSMPHGAGDPIGVSWLVTARWTTLGATVGAMLAGDRLDAHVSLAVAVVVFVAIAASNVWLIWRGRHGRVPVPAAGGLLVCLDVVLLSWLLLESGGALNPASIFYLVQIVLAALVLGRRWAWTVTALSIGGYGALFLVPSGDLRVAQAMHPEIALHMRGMWLAFALTALIIAVLVTRLAIAVERRDRALETLRDRHARAARFASLTTAVAGAAHELSTPLGTIAVAARELERALAARHPDPDLRADTDLIRAEIDRCRSVLERMAKHVSEPLGEVPRLVTPGAVLHDAVTGFTAEERARIDLMVREAAPVMWPGGVVAQALGGIIKNALHASGAGQSVAVEVWAHEHEHVRVEIRDQGAGMSADELARAGEPFFTTKAPGVGTGLGLFVARSTFDQLGGTLILTSRAGSGTTVTVTLPRNVTRLDDVSHE